MNLQGSSLATTLSQAVVAALVRIGVTQDEVLGGEIKHTDLPWQIPPLIVEATLLEVPLSQYFEAAVFVNVEAMYNLWSDALANLRNRPSKVVTDEGYRTTSYALPQVRTSERQMHLSLPEGFPHGVTDLAGVTLSLECAHLLKHSARLENFTESDNDYFAELPGNVKIGVQAGLPTLYGDVWDMPVLGMVPELLRTPRGSVWEGCDYNIISKVRSVVACLDDNLRDVEAMGWALQALRVIDGHKELLQAVRKMTTMSRVRKERLALLQDALHVSQQIAITDRQRINTLRQLLVPEVLTPAQFSKQVYLIRQVPPPMLADKVLLRIQQNVAQLLENEERLNNSPLKGAL